MQLALEQRVKSRTARSRRPPRCCAGGSASPRSAPARSSTRPSTSSPPCTCGCARRRLGDRLEPEERALALQRVKAYIALHNCYGVDLNETAVELAEVSIWLNVMHRGLQAPWFGLHLVRGNSLIGARPPACTRRTQLAKGEWLNTAPTDHPFSAGRSRPGTSTTSCSPPTGWGAVAGEKEAKRARPGPGDQQLGDLAQAASASAPSAKKSAGHKLTQVQRLQALAGPRRVPVVPGHRAPAHLRARDQPRHRRLGRGGPAAGQEAIPRDKIVADLTAPGTPYWRLKTVMDAWCALWFWPLDKAGLLDGSRRGLRHGPAARAGQPEPAPSTRTPRSPRSGRWTPSSATTPKQLTLAEAAPRKPRPEASPRRPPPRSR